MKILNKTIIASAYILFNQSVLAVDCTGLDVWDAVAEYNGGQQIQYNNNAYQANWWTSNHNPESHSGQWQEWNLLGSCDGGGSNQLPTANANGPYNGLINSPIAFDSSGSNDPDGNIASYHWVFGDGNTSSQANPSHQYTSAGSYNVSLSVTDNSGATDLSSTVATITASGGGGCSETQYLAGTVYSAGDLVANLGRKYRCDIAGWCSSSADWAYEPGVGSSWQAAWTDTGVCGDGSENQPPSAVANGPYSGVENQAILLNSAGSADPDGNIASFHWSFGDGNSSTQQNPSHTYTSVGNFTITLTVTDNQGATASQSTTANITSGGNQPPVANVNGPYSGTPASNIQFSSAGSNDPDGTISQYSWSFGDGATSNLANPSHSYTSAGSYTVELTVTDDQGSSSTQSTSANVTNGGGSGGDKVIGYFAEWGVYGRNYHVKNIHTSGSASKLTHIMYAFGNVTNGQCVIGDSFAAYDKAYGAGESVDGVADTWDAGTLRGNFGQLRRLKKMYPNIKVVWSFGGWTWSGGFGQAAANPVAFANSCYDLVFDPRWADVFDGIDIDWEYPNDCGLSCDTSGFEGYRNLMQAMRAKFGNKLVTAAISSGESKLNAADYGGAAQYVDFYMLMSYDFFGAWSATGPTAPHSALHQFSGIPIAGFYADKGVQVLRSKGVPADKILLGIGFYGRGWTGVTQATPGGTATGAATGTYEAGIEDYKVLKNSCPATGQIAGTSYAKCANNWWSYDTPATISGKMNYLKQQGLGGAFFWEFSGDTSDGELIKAISDGL